MLVKKREAGDSSKVPAFFFAFLAIGITLFLLYSRCRLHPLHYEHSVERADHHENLGAVCSPNAEIACRVPVFPVARAMKLNRLDGAWAFPDFLHSLKRRLVSFALAARCHANSETEENEPDGDSEKNPDKSPPTESCLAACPHRTDFVHPRGALGMRTPRESWIFVGHLILLFGDFFRRQLKSSRNAHLHHREKHHDVCGDDHDGKPPYDTYCSFHAHPSPANCEA
jgi:hypothetical protein